jgi:virginiamycin A acetyltransferase
MANAMGLLDKIGEKLRMRWWRARQHDSIALRSYYRDHFTIDVGLQSYGCFDRWRMPGPIKVGRYCSIASTVRSAPINHPHDALTTHPVLFERKFGAVDKDIRWDAVLTIGDDVWIGHNAMILPGCKAIGRGAIIGAGAIVTRDVPAYAIVAGNPAKLLRMRFDDATIAAIEASHWWQLDPADIRALLASEPDTLFHPTPARLAKLIARTTAAP